MQLKKALIVLLDELIFRPAVAIINWQPSRRKPCTCPDCHRDIDCLVFNEVPIKRQQTDYDWRGPNYGV